MNAVILLPDFELQAALRPRPALWKKPAALLSDLTPKARLIQMTPPAAQAGVEIGLTATQGLARCPGLEVLHRNAGLEEAAQAALLACATAISPRVETTAPGTCTLDLRGSPYAWASARHASLGDRILREMKASGLAAQIGVAAHPDLALLAAREARPFWRIENSCAALAGLPVRTLQPSDETAAILQSWGIRTIGDLTALPSQELCQRLGPEAMALLSRARGQSTRLLRVSTPPEEFAESMEFEHPVECLEPLLFILRRFLGQLGDRLAAAHQVAEALDLNLAFADGSRYGPTLQVPHPTRDPSLLFRMAHTHLEDFRAAAPVVALSLKIHPVRERHQQFHWLESSLKDPHQFAETLARLSALLGAGRIGTPVLESSHRPDAFHLAPIHENENLPPLPARPAPPPAGLALRKFRPALPAEVRRKQHGARTPIHLTASPYQGLIRESRGPWRRSGEWWDRNPWSREEWDVQLEDGPLLRLAHASNKWVVDGIYD